MKHIIISTLALVLAFGVVEPTQAETISSLAIANQSSSTEIQSLMNKIKELQIQLLRAKIAELQKQLASMISGGTSTEVDNDSDNSDSSYTNTDDDSSYTNNYQNKRKYEARVTIDKAFNLIDTIKDDYIDKFKATVKFEEKLSDDDMELWNKVNELHDKGGGRTRSTTGEHKYLIKNLHRPDQRQHQHHNQIGHEQWQCDAPQGAPG